MTLLLGRVGGRRVRFRRRFTRHGRSRFCGQLREGQHQLLRVELLAALAEHTPQQQVQVMLKLTNALLRLLQRLEQLHDQRLQERGSSGSSAEFGFRSASALMATQLRARSPIGESHFQNFVKDIPSRQHWSLVSQDLDSPCWLVARSASAASRSTDRCPTTAATSPEP